MPDQSPLALAVVVRSCEYHAFIKVLSIPCNPANVVIRNCGLIVVCLLFEVSYFIRLQEAWHYFAPLPMPE